MSQIPLGLFLLLHYIIPSVNIIFTKLIKKIERRTRECKDLSVLFLESFYYIVTKLCLCSFMSLINNN